MENNKKDFSREDGNMEIVPRKDSNTPAKVSKESGGGVELSREKISVRR